MPRPASIIPPSLRSACTHPLSVFLLGCILTTFGIFVLRAELRRNDALRFDRHTERILVAISNRLAEYDRIARAGLGLFAASQHVDRHKWKTFVESLHLDNLPGMIGFGFLERIPSDQLPSYVQRMRSGGATMFELHLLPGNSVVAPNDDRLVISYLEPQQTNAAAIGLDLSGNTEIRKTAQRAVKEDRPIITPKLTTLNGQPSQASAILLAPVYSDYAPGQLENHRSAILKGWVYLPLVFERVLGDVAASKVAEVDFQVFDGNSTNQEALLFDSLSKRPRVANASAAPALSTIRSFDFAGRSWAIHIAARPEF
ncbi:MAG: CHASE domain-containing protein, partial [Deltaproteobacteria bacterium]|nr:CHASE domain-containing protein [Deltaproteobacteria bacterium]